MNKRALSVFVLLAAAAGFGCGDTVSSSSNGSGSGSSGSGSSGNGTSGSGASSNGSSSTGTLGSGSSSGGDTGSSGSSGTTGVDGGCFAPRDPDAMRYVVVSHPYLPDAGRSPDYEVLELSPTGQLASKNQHFTMRRASVGHIAFTPDGRNGLVAQEDGTLGEFALYDDGGVQVLEDGFGGFYASSVAFSADGMRGYVLDSETPDNGGGLYAFDVACDGTLGAPELQGNFQVPDALAFLHQSPTRAIIAGGNGSASQDDVSYVELGDGGSSVLSSASMFPDGNAIPSGAAVTEDDAYVLVSDDGLFGGNRVGVARIDSSGVTAVQTLSTSNPADVVTSPFNNAALILNSDGTDGLTAVDYEPSNTSAPFAVRGAISYVGPHPQLPAEAVVIRRGVLKGRVLVGELSGVRQVQFEPDGGVTDLSIDNGNGSFEEIVGALGVQP